MTELLHCTCISSVGKYGPLKVVRAGFWPLPVEMAEEVVDNVLKNGPEMQRLPNRHLSELASPKFLELVD
jgi:hypothetical protein